VPVWRTFRPIRAGDGPSPLPQGWGGIGRGGGGKNGAARVSYWTPARAIQFFFITLRRATSAGGIGAGGGGGYPAPMSNLRALPAPPARLSAALRRAIDVRVRKGASITEACREAGLSTAGWHKAMKRPPVQEHLRAVQAAFVAEAEGRRAVLRARALEVAADLMMNATSEAIRARMVEFLAADAKVSPVAVHVDARRIEAPGYAYVRPGQRLADVAGE
jgi:hypothetical protein